MRVVRIAVDYFSSQVGDVVGHGQNAAASGGHDGGQVVEIVTGDRAVQLRLGKQLQHVGTGDHSVAVIHGSGQALHAWIIQVGSEPIRREGGSYRHGGASDQRGGHQAIFENFDLGANSGSA